MVPTFTCGLSRSNFCFANVLAPHLLLVERTAQALRGMLRGRAAGSGPTEKYSWNPARGRVSLPACVRTDAYVQAVAPTGVPLRCSVISSASAEGISA